MITTDQLRFPPEELPAGLRVRIDLEAVPLTLEQVGVYLRNDQAFRSAFNDHLAECPYEAFFWEVRPASLREGRLVWEHVILKASPQLGRSADSTAFREHFTTESGVVTFENLGGDAHLVVPCPVAGLSYGHLAPFCRSAPRNQQDQLWQQVGTTFVERMASSRTFWLSTAGFGVPWLHVRFDSSPKYYRHGPYRGAH